MKKKALLVFFALLNFAHDPFASANWVQTVQKTVGMTQSAQGGEDKIASGLKEALGVGFEKTVALLGQKDGYFKNEKVKILLPGPLKKADGILRAAGLGGQVDQLVLSMNRAAEAAAPQAKTLFVDAIKTMKFEDVKKIYSGKEDAATQFLKEKTYRSLKEAYTPVVSKTMKSYEVTKLYQTAVQQYQATPLGKQLKAPQVEDYVVTKSLDGLFKMLAEQEKMIRTDPAARVTQLLREVFGR